MYNGVPSEVHSEVDIHMDISTLRQIESAYRDAGSIGIADVLLGAINIIDAQAAKIVDLETELENQCSDVVPTNWLTKEIINAISNT